MFSDECNGRVRYCWHLHHHRPKADRDDTLAAALRMPDHAATPPRRRYPTGARCSNSLLCGGKKRTILPTPGHLLEQDVVIPEQHEMAQLVEQGGGSAQARAQCLQFVELPLRVETAPSMACNYIKRSPGSGAGPTRPRYSLRSGAGPTTVISALQRWRQTS